MVHACPFLSPPNLASFAFLGTLRTGAKLDVLKTSHYMFLATPKANVYVFLVITLISPTFLFAEVCLSFSSALVRLRCMEFLGHPACISTFFKKLFYLLYAIFYLLLLYYFFC